jgi:hypothetical protein
VTSGDDERERPPEPLPQSLALALRRYTDARRMPEGARMRVARGLARPRGLRRDAVIAVVIAVAAALVLAWALRPRVAVRHASEVAAEQASDHTIVAPPQVVRPGVPPPAELPPAPSIVAPRTALPPQVPTPSDSPAHTATSARPRVGAAAEAGPERVQALEDSLSAERALLAEAWAAFTAADLSRARAAVDAHRRRFAEGALAPERDALAASIRCRVEGPDPAIAEAFVRAQPDSPHAPRVRAACTPAAGTQ